MKQIKEFFSIRSRFNLKKNVWLAFLALAISSAILTGCSEPKKIKIGVSQCSDDDWRKKMNEEIEREAMFQDNVEVEIRSAYDSNDKQIADLNYFADNDFDIIVAAPNEAAPITPTIDSIMKRGIPVMIFDRSVSNNNYTAFQGADNDSIGCQVADYVNQLFDGPKRVIEILGNPGSTPTLGRHNGFAREIAKYPDIEVIAQGNGNWNYSTAARKVDSLFKVYEDVDVIYAHNDRMALAAADVADSLNRSVYIIGVDAAPEIGMKGVADGKLTATFLYPTEGHKLVKTALAIVKGEKFNKESVEKASTVVDKSNADILILQNQSLKEETSKMENLKSEVDKYWTAHNAQKIFLYVLLALLLMLFVLLILFLRAFWQKQYQQKLLIEKNKELEVQRDNEKKLNQQLQEATQSKLTFFTNVSHDLRTPLTLISEPVKQLVSASNLTDEQHKLVKLANKNVKILQRLINQVLDFRKYESGRLNLVLTEVYIRSLIEEWTESFYSVARARHIKLRLENLPENINFHIALDVEKIERVFFNLLSNAFKYSPDNSRINVKVEIEKEKLRISVSDTGNGISSEDLPKIFDRFYQAEKVHPTGSGIGLSLAKAFVELHEGSLSVESEQGKGSIFTIEIPVRHVAGQPAEIVGKNITSQEVNEELGIIDSFEGHSLFHDDKAEDNVKEENKEEQAKPLVLVIDDNADILAMLSELLKGKYRVITAQNGSDGVRKAAKYIPDIVVCDVMMPVMDGMECCRRIKTEVSTSHVPVMMLTACSMDEQRVQGYESGADGYVSKPFNSDVLMARIENLIENRRRILDLYHKNGTPGPESGILHETPGKLSKTSATAVDKGTSVPQRPLHGGDIDSEFYNRFLEVLKGCIGDADINVDSLAAEMGLGRSQFYRKIKALTNFSPVELIRNIRLKEARNLLLTTELSISEIAYKVGFSTPAYFTKCYREGIGETPTETRRNLVK
ncbi:MAG: substrate-binding domain-containing protein [Bacteroidales bacterium]|nr:substrate-binding domain-containing protein [Bacteroidales bacterium]